MKNEKKKGSPTATSPSAAGHELDAFGLSLDLPLAYELDARGRSRLNPILWEKRSVFPENSESAISEYSTTCQCLGALLGRAGRVKFIMFTSMGWGATFLKQRAAGLPSASEMSSLFASSS